MPRGGPRPGSGRPKGSVAPATLIKQAADRLYRQKVAEMAEDLFKAQKELALGVWVEQPDQDGGVRVYKKPPDSRTITDMLDRAVTGKPAQAVDVTSGGEPIQIKHVFAAESK